MDDLISRQAAIEALEREKTYCRAFREGYAPVDVFEKYNAGLTDGIKAISSLPSAQPEIIRCRDCKHWDKTWTNNWSPDYHYCPKIDEVRKGDFYCRYAERRTNE